MTERKLALCRAYGWSVKTQRHDEVEPVWHEVYMFKGKWEFWCGKVGTTSTATLNIIRFADVPK